MIILVNKDGGVERLSALPATSALSIHTDTNKPQQSCLANLIIWGLMGASLLTLPLSCYAAISATTSQTIQGSAPYLTFDGGVTKVTTTDALLGITISDGTPAGTTTYTKSTNNSAVTPIELPVAGQTFDDVLMLVPPTAPPVSATDPTQTVNLTDVIGAPNNYWGDDDGDGQGASGITATGTLKVEIKDKYGLAVNRSDTLSICNAPYQVKLTSTAGTLKTQYGDPSQSKYIGDNTTYYISPKVSTPVVCFAKPDMTNSTGQYAGPANMWNTTKGFIPQATTPANYGDNFPTTGANNLSFELDIGGAPSGLTWTTAKASATADDITATPSACATPRNSCVKYTLTGPAATATEQTDANPGAITPAPTLPTTLVLEGQSGGTTVVKYGFVIKQWFINRGTVLKPATTTTVGADTQTNWCSSIGYSMPTVADLTNAQGTAGGWGGMIPMNLLGSAGNYAVRRVGGGLFAEWGAMNNYTGAGFMKFGSYPTTQSVGIYTYYGRLEFGEVNSVEPAINGTPVVCTLP